MSARRRVGIPATVALQSKPQLAILMLHRLLPLPVSIDWVVADSVYGSNPDLRDWLHAHQQPYVMGVACKEPVVLDVASQGVRRLHVRDLPALLSASHWQTMSMSQGTKGPRLFEWTCLPIWHQGADDGWHRILIRRTLDCTPLLAFFLVFAPPATSLSCIVTALGGRWRIEEDFENGKDLGLDHYEVRSFVGWYRHITLVLLALAFLTSICLHTAAPDTDLCPLCVPEVRHVLARVLFPAPSNPAQVLAWSLWRRKHQHLACFLQTRRRLKAS